MRCSAAFSCRFPVRLSRCRVRLPVLQKILERFPRRIAEAQTVADKLEIRHVGRLLARAYRASWDPQGVQEAVDRELVMVMPWLAVPPAPTHCRTGRRCDRLDSSRSDFQTATAPSCFRLAGVLDP